MPIAPLDLQQLAASGVTVLRLVERADGTPVLVDNAWREYTGPVVGPAEPIRLITTRCENGMCGACSECEADEDERRRLLGEVVDILEGERHDVGVKLADTERLLRLARHDLEAERREAGKQREARLRSEAELREAGAVLSKVDSALQALGVPGAVSVGGQERTLTFDERVRTVGLRMVRAELELGDMKARAHAARILGPDGQAVLS